MSMSLALEVELLDVIKSFIIWSHSKSALIVLTLQLSGNKSQARALFPPIRLQTARLQRQCASLRTAACLQSLHRTHQMPPEPNRTRMHGASFKIVFVSRYLG